MTGVAFEKKVTISLTAEDWQLYDGLMAETAAQAINTVIEAHFNAGKTKRETSQAACQVMNTYADQGAIDSEPLWVLEKLLNELYV